jgi:hypothetical protein
MKTLYMKMLAVCALTTSTFVAAQSVPAQGKRAMSPLQNLLSVFASRKAAPWPSFDAVPGVHWRDTKPLENPDANSADETVYRSGNLLLSGFGQVDVPDGKVGADAGIREDNEGDVGVTLNGNPSSVQSIALQKFYPSDNYTHILQQQFDTNAMLKPVAGQCALDYGTTAVNTQKNAFYQITFDTTTSIYVEAYIDEDGGNQGPGFTTFIFTLSKPAQRIVAMQCKEY